MARIILLFSSTDYIFCSLFAQKYPAKKYPLHARTPEIENVVPQNPTQGHYLTSDHGLIIGNHKSISCL